jgi:cytochrome c oxidase subunit 4
MSPNDKNRPRRDVRRVPNQPGGRSSGQPRPAQPRPQGPASGPLRAVPAGGHAVAAERPHPSATVYIQIAVVLAAITGAEVAVYYLDTIKSLLVPILLVLSAMKFALVVAFYMHLRFDSKVFRNLFLFGLFVAASIIVALLFINSYHGSVPGAGLV